MRNGSIVALWLTYELPEGVIVPVVVGAVRGGGWWGSALKS